MAPGIPVVRKESEGRVGNGMANRPTPARPNWAAYSRRPPSMKKAIPSGTKPRPSYVGAIESCEEFGRRLYAEPGSGGWARAEKKVVLGDAPNGFGIRRIYTFPRPPKSSISISCSRAPVELRRQTLSQPFPCPETWVMVRKDKLDEGKIERLVALLRSQAASNPPWQRTCEPKPTTSKPTKNGCAIPRFASWDFSWAPASLKLGANRVGQAQTLRHVLDRAWSQCHPLPSAL